MAGRPCHSYPARSLRGGRSGGSVTRVTTPFLTERRARFATGLPADDTLLLVAAGHPVPRPENSDQTYPFLAHTEYVYLAGRDCAGGVVAFDPRNGPRRGWRDFVPDVTESERVWEGRRPWPGESLAELPGWLEARRDRPLAWLGSPPQSGAVEGALTAPVREILTATRRVKDETEIALVRRAVDATAAGFARLRALLRPGVSERSLQIELEAEFFRHGATRTGYGSIVGSGPNSAILHFEPSGRGAQAGEFVLVDAGAEIDRYTADVTRTYIAGQPSSFQGDLYAVVLRAQERAVARCLPGAEWKEVHLATAVDLVSGLVELGVMRGNAEALIEREAHTLFFPHGLGHMFGLGVRDASGLAPGRQKDPRPALRTLRMDLPLATGYLVTVEPGLYFIPPLLDDPERRKRFHDCVNWSLVDQHRSIGGVRIEDNVLVTDGAPEVLTRMIPKDLESCTVTTRA